MRIGSLSAGPCCEIDKFIVQVVGKDHDDSQKLILTSPDGSAVYRSEPETLEHERFSCLLEVWDRVAGAQLHLDIATVDGAPLRLPLLSDTRVTPRQIGAQFNQLVPVLPFVSLPGSKTVYDLGTPVLARAGYVYVFYHQTLWRELKVRVSETGTTYHDIDVAAHRCENGFSTGERPVRGVALDDIWLPARWNNHRLQDLQLCFSEIQLSAPRLERLEKDATLRAQRCQNPDLICSNERLRDLYTGKPEGDAMLKAFSCFDGKDPVAQILLAPVSAVKLSLVLHAFPVTLAAPQRARQPGYERLLDHPALYLCDLSGQYPVTALEQAKAFLAQADEGTAPPNTLALELTAVSDALLATLPSDTEREPQTPTDTTALWNAQPSVVDVLSKARRRQVYGVLLDDACYRIRHLRQRLETHQQLLGLCARLAIQHPHHASALLVQQLVIPRVIRGSENPLHKAAEKLKLEGRQTINRCTAAAERIMVWQHMLSAQNALVETLEQNRTVQTLADHLSLEGFEYVAAMFDLSRTLAAIVLKPSGLDPLAPSGDIVDAVTEVSQWECAVSKGQKFLARISNDTQSALHTMLWPPTDPAAVAVPYQKPDTQDRNLGDGRFRPSELARFEQHPAPDPVAQLTLDATVLANLLAGDSLQNFLLINSGKATTAALVSIYENLQSAVDNAASAVDAANQNVSSATNSANAARQPQPKPQPDSRSGTSTRRINVTRQGRGVQHLRSMMPEHFGAAFLTKRNQVKPGDYVFGLEDLPDRASMPNKRYGEYLTADGKPFQDIDPPFKHNGSLPSGEHHVLVMPRGHRTAQIVSDINRKLKSAWEAGQKIKDADLSQAQARSALNDAIDSLDTQTNSAAYRILGSTGFCLAVLMLEAWNVSSEAEGLSQSMREKNRARAALGLVSAVLDLALATEALTFKLIDKQSKKILSRKVILSFSEEGLTKWMGPAIGSILTKELSIRLGVQLLSAGLLTVLNLYDTWHAWHWNDQAMYGYLLMSLGGLLATLSSALSGMALFAGLNPFGWAALLLLISGAGLVFWLSATPVESWLANGPFGQGKRINNHLQNPLDAFYRLIGVLAGITITIGKNPAYEQDAKFDFRAQTPYAVRSANTVIRLESRLPGLINNFESVNIHAECKLIRITERSNNQGVPYRAGSEIPEQSTTPQAQRVSANALELFFFTPNGSTRTSEWSTTHHFKWAVRAQFIFRRNNENHYFPTPSIKDPTLFSQERTKPDFAAINQPFLADEITHKGTYSE